MEFTSRQLRAFQLVAQHRSFTRATEALFITTSGLSVLIRELETQLGFRLFDCTTRQVVTTAYGDELLATTQPHLQALDAAMTRIGRVAKERGQILSVGTTPLVAANILPQAIKEFRSLRPDLRIRLFDADLATILKRVEAGNLDMGLGIFRSVPGIRRAPFSVFSGRDPCRQGRCNSTRIDGVVCLERADTHLSASTLSSPAAHRRAFGEYRCPMATRFGGQFPGHTDRLGRGGRGHCHYSLV
jgi:DNA-binding transcriptional LysR family regulator